MNLMPAAPAETVPVPDNQDVRHQTERPPAQREGVVSDPDQYFPDAPPSARRYPE